MKMKLLEIIKNRKTEKILGSVSSPLKNSPVNYDITLWLESIAYSPFHYPCDISHQQGNLKSIMPWRFYILDSSSCRKLLDYYIQNGIETAKIGQMLATCDYLIQATWLPDSTETNQLFDPTLQNMEHIAAGSAAIQNLLLIATEAQVPNYWSSGGVLRSEETFDFLKISKNEILLGGIFLFPNNTQDTQTVNGAWRHKRGEVNQWAKFID
jgi:hypothetical protein